MVGNLCGWWPLQWLLGCRIALARYTGCIQAHTCCHNMGLSQQLYCIGSSRGASSEQQAICKAQRQGANITAQAQRRGANSTTQAEMQATVAVGGCCCLDHPICLGQRPSAKGPWPKALGQRPLAKGPWPKAHGQRPLAKGP